ncbi:hypothetical protein AAFC00_002439 [Neodothiora populina]|uniref:Endo-1,3(4)-beta-glucanase 1 carbohydrate binding domain-containing protein n=1 Tax=Neodothiora populina TaxID=2781224 RepID=A0ABR3P7D5_9PEZI
MAWLRYAFATLAVALILNPSEAAIPRKLRRDLETCGESIYNTDRYICYEDELLCPVIAGEALKLCGSSCFSSYMYTCTDNTLSVLPRSESVFTLTAVNPAATFHGSIIEASGTAFYIGLSGPSTNCPSPPLSDDACAYYAGTNTSLGTIGLAVAVPGGQATYWTKTGALRYTIPHSGNEPDLAFRSSIAYAGGGYFGPHNEILTACPVSLPDDDGEDNDDGDDNSGNATSLRRSTWATRQNEKMRRDQSTRSGKKRAAAAGEGGLWQVFSRLEEVQFASECVDFYAVLNTEAEHTVGAWEYT